MIKPEVFKQVRKALGLTQQELADAIGLSRVTINKMEQGRLKRGIPDEIAARLLALKPRYTNAAGYDGPGAQSPRAKSIGEDHHLWDNEEDE